MNVVKETDIAAPPEKVYEYLLQFPRHSEWTTPGHGVHITPESDGAIAEGSKFKSEAHQMGAQLDHLVVTDLEPNRRIVYQATMKNGSVFRHTLDIAPSGVGSHLSKRFESVKLGLVDKLMSAVAGAVLAPGLLKGDLERIKANLERNGAG
jgi:uncharacterized protein YndB with AHSA1/START domain